YQLPCPRSASRGHAASRCRRVSESRQPHRLKIAPLVANIGTSSLIVDRVNETEMPATWAVSGPDASGGLEAGAVEAFEKGGSVAVALAKLTQPRRELVTIAVAAAEVAQVAQQGDGRVVLLGLLGIHKHGDPLPGSIALACEFVKATLPGHGRLALRLRLL